MLEFVDVNFEHGFRKSATARQVPRVRFEAISVGTGLALRGRPDLRGATDIDTAPWLQSDEFREITTSDAANVRSRVLGRISFVYNRLIAA